MAVPPAAEASAKDGDMPRPRSKFNRKKQKFMDEPLPGGLYVEICKRHQVLPGPAANRALELLRERATRGELLPSQHWDYYLAALEDEDVPGLRGEAC